MPEIYKKTYLFAAMQNGLSAISRQPTCFRGQNLELTSQFFAGLFGHQTLLALAFFLFRHFQARLRRAAAFFAASRSGQGNRKKQDEKQRPIATNLHCWLSFSFSSSHPWQKHRWRGWPVGNQIRDYMLAPEQLPQKSTIALVEKSGKIS